MTHTKFFFKNSISFAMVCLSTNSFIGFDQANAMLLTKEVTRSSIPKKFIHNHIAPAVGEGLARVGSGQPLPLVFILHEGLRNVLLLNDL